MALIFTALCIGQAGLHIWESTTAPSGYGTIGLRLGRPCHTLSFCEVQAVAKAGPAEAAGLRPGDKVRPDEPTDAMRRYLAGETIGLTVLGRTGDRHVVLKAVARPGRVIPQYIVAASAMILAALIGGLVILRSQGRPAVVLIGLAYASYAITGQWPRLWENHPALYASFYVVLNVIYYGSPLLFLAAARAFRKEVSGKDTLGIRLAFWLLVLTQGSLLTIQLHAQLAGQPTMLASNEFLIFTGPVFVGYVLAAVVLTMAWRESPPEARSRYGMMLIAIALTFLSGVTDMSILLTGNDYITLSPLMIAWHLFFTSGALLFGYAILRHRVVDLGFAVNRTLVYGMLSSVLLFAFGVAEWALEEIIPVESKEANILISAGIALSIFLVFHHARDWVEKTVEHLFFRSWRENEVRLKRFLKEAAFITRPETLRTATVAAFGRFGHGANVVLYEAEGEAYRGQGGGTDPGAPPTFDADQPFLVRLRAERGPIHDDEILPAGVALVAPTLYRGEVTGFFLVPPKPSGEPWRPDETALLADAAVRIGLDMHALRVEQLENDRRDLNRRAELLERQLQRALSGGAPA